MTTRHINLLTLALKRTSETAKLPKTPTDAEQAAFSRLVINERERLQADRLALNDFDFRTKYSKWL